MLTLDGICPHGFSRPEFPYLYVLEIIWRLSRTFARAQARASLNPSRLERSYELAGNQQHQYQAQDSKPNA